MLSPADRRLVRGNPSVPGLACLLDDDAMCDTLRAALPGYRIDSVTRTYVRFKPQRNCLVRFRARIDGRTVGFYAKAFGDDWPEKRAKALKRAGTPGPLGAGRVLIDDSQLSLAFPPNDDKLRILHRLGDEPARHELLARLAPDARDIASARLDTLQYKPERRYVARLSTADGYQSALKFYTRDSAYATALHNALAASASSNGLFPRLIAHDDGACALAFEWIDGTLLTEAYGRDDFDLDLIVRLGATLARLHREPLDDHAATGAPSDQVRRLVELGDALATLLPECGERAAALVNRIATLLADIPPLARRIHGDFYAKQVLYTHDALRLVDSDEMQTAHPGQDLGLFIAHLVWDVLRGNLAQSRAGAIERALLTGYRREADIDLSERDVSTFVACGLMTLAHHPFRNCEPDWPARIAALLARIERLLNHTGNRHGAAPVHLAPAQAWDGTPLLADPALSFLGEAITLETASAVLRDCLPAETAGAGALLDARLRRHKHGRRCLIEYRLGNDTGAAVWFGKCRARGLDRRTLDLNRTLYARGFGPDAPDGVQVPRPLGAVARWNMWLQERADGIDAFRYLGTNDLAQSGLRIASALHKLHDTRRLVRRWHGPAEEIEILDRSLRPVIAAYPGWRHTIERVRDNALAMAQQLDTTREVTLHRDFYHDQLLMTDDTIVLLDLDLCARGDAALDLGNFAAHVQEQCLRLFGDPTRFDEAVDAMVEHYCALSGIDLRTATDAYTTLSLVRHIGISQRLPERRAATPLIIDWCEQRLSWYKVRRHAG